MSPLHILFSGYGRINRMTYFAYSLFALATFIALMIGGAVHWEGGFGPTALLGVVIVLVAIFANMWVGLALAIKRLHDLGMSGLHLIWMSALDVILQGVSGNPDLAVVALVLALVSLGAKLCLLLCPGQKFANAYGHPPA